MKLGEHVFQYLCTVAVKGAVRRYTSKPPRNSYYRVTRSRTWPLLKVVKAEYVRYGLQGEFRKIVSPDPVDNHLFEWIDHWQDGIDFGNEEFMGSRNSEVVIKYSQDFEPIS